MKPAWDALMEEFKDSKTALVADVDCTVEETLCSQHGVQGYPTIKYGSPDALEDYNGGRDLEELKTFAAENLGPTCGPDNIDLCSAEQKETIATLQAMSKDERAAKIADGEKKIADAESLFSSEVEKLQAKYEELTKEKEDTIKEAKKPLGLLKMIQKSTQSKDEM